jgi:lactate permease
MPWIQAYSPIGDSAGLSAAVAAVPLGVIFICLAVFRMPVLRASQAALAAALLIGVFAWGMPAGLVALAAAQGAAFGLFPVFYIVLGSLFLFNLTVKGGQFEIIRASLASVTPDRRLQAILIAFSFGAFIEGCAGFGAPVAIAGATLVGLGFRPFYAAGICLLANTAPVAFGTMGIPIVSLGGVIGLSDPQLMRLSAIVGHQLPLISLFIPAYLVLIISGLRGTLEVLPAVVVSGGVFAAFQWSIASFVGPYLPDLLASLASMAALGVLLRFWRPRTVFRFENDPRVAAEQAKHTSAEVLRAWSSYLVLAALVLAWNIPAVKAALGRATVMVPVPGLDGAVATPARAIGQTAIPLAAKFKFDVLAGGGSAVLFAAILSVGLCRVRPTDAVRVLGRTLLDMRKPAFAIACVLAMAYVMNASGMTQCLGIFSTRAGQLFPLVSPILGWLGVVLTGSDTSSNVLFGSLQTSAATSLGMNPLLAASANTCGGVMGKMISPQSVAVACAATGMVGQEGTLFRFTLRHSLFLLAIMGVMTYFQAHALAWMLPH